MIIIADQILPYHKIHVLLLLLLLLLLFVILYSSFVLNTLKNFSEAATDNNTSRNGGHRTGPRLYYNNHPIWLHYGGKQKELQKKKIPTQQLSCQPLLGVGSGRVLGKTVVRP
jgi:hypothetical protein